MVIGITNDNSPFASDKNKVGSASKSGSNRLPTVGGEAYGGSDNGLDFGNNRNGMTSYLEMIADPTPTTPTPTTPTPTAPTPTDPALDAYNRAIAYGGQQVASRGFNQGLVDQYGILDLYKADIDRQRGTIASDAADPYSLYSRDTFFNNAVNDAQGRYRADLRNTLNSGAAEGFEYGQFAETADDALLADILAQQREDAQLVIDRSRARGSLNDGGYNRANNALNDQNAAGMSALQSTGGGVLADYRKQLSEGRTNALNRINTADFTTPFDVGGAVGRLNDLRTQFSTNMGNDIKRAVGGANYFDPSVAISKGGQTQGTVNPSRVNPEGNPLFAAFAAEDRKKQLGGNTGSTATTGAF